MCMRVCLCACHHVASSLIKAPHLVDRTRGLAAGPAGCCTHDTGHNTGQDRAKEVVTGGVVSESMTRRHTFEAIHHTDYCTVHPVALAPSVYGNGVNVDFSGAKYERRRRQVLTTIIWV